MTTLDFNISLKITIFTSNRFNQGHEQRENDILFEMPEDKENRSTECTLFGIGIKGYTTVFYACFSYDGSEISVKKLTNFVHVIAICTSVSMFLIFLP